MSNATILAIAAMASTVAAIASAVVAIAGWRVQKMLLHSEVMPNLRPSYKFDDSHIEIANIGKGVAQDLKLQRSQQHFLDTKEIVSFTIGSDSSRTVYPQENIRVSIVPVLEQRKRLTSDTMRFYLFQFVNGIGMHRQLGLIYKDVFNRRMILRVKFTNDYKLASR